MDRDTRPRLPVFLAVVLVALGLTLGTSSAAPAAASAPPDTVAVASGPVDSGPASTAAGSTTSVNPFIPEDANLSDCISALPRPDCGSKARGGWRQGLVFGVIAAGLALIGWRLVVAVRRRDRATA